MGHSIAAFCFETGDYGLPLFYKNVVAYLLDDLSLDHPHYRDFWAILETFAQEATKAINDHVKVLSSVLNYVHFFSQQRTALNRLKGRNGQKVNVPGNMPRPTTSPGLSARGQYIYPSNTL